MTMRDLDLFVPIFKDDKIVPRKLRREYIEGKNPMILLVERSRDNVRYFERLKKKKKKK